MNNVIRKIKDDYLNMSDTNKLIADTILKYQNNFNLTVKELSQESYCAPSTIIKFCNSLGYNSYKIFKYEMNLVDSSEYDTIIRSFDLVKTFMNINKQEINLFITNILNAPQIYLFASGQSRIPALDFYLKINKKLDDKAIFEYEPAVQKRIIKTINSDDLVIFVSNSGLSKELIAFHPLIQQQTNNLYLVSNRTSSSLASLIDKKFILDNHIESAQDFKEFPRESKYSILYFFDQIFTQL